MQTIKFITSLIGVVALFFVVIGAVWILYDVFNYLVLNGYESVAFSGVAWLVLGICVFTHSAITEHLRLMGMRERGRGGF